MWASIGLRAYMRVLIFPDFDIYWSTDPLGISSVGRWWRGAGLTKSLNISMWLTPRTHQEATLTMTNWHMYTPSWRRSALNARCSITPTEHLSLDEAMVPFRGWLGWRQYVPAKMTKYGIKIWMRADPANGYSNDFQIYAGKVQGTIEMGLGSQVVRDSTWPLVGHIFIVNCGNFFTSLELFCSLLEDKIYVCGTVKANRKDMPPVIQFSNKNLRKQGDMVVVQKSDLVAVKWRDKRVFKMVSAADCPLASTTLKRKKVGSLGAVPSHVVIGEYNNNMNIFDHADQLWNQCSTIRESHKWWHCLMWFLIDAAMCNSYILKKELPSHQLLSKNGRKKDRPLLSFKMALAKLLIGSYRCSRKCTLVLSIDPLGNSLMLIKGRASRCWECWLSGCGRDESTTCCQACNLALCVLCFEAYHYWLINECLISWAVELWL